MTDSLITQDSEQIRGRIKQINDLLRLPEILQAEAVALKQGLPEKAHKE